MNQPPARAPVRAAPGRGNTPVGARAGVPASRSGSGLGESSTIVDIIDSRTTSADNYLDGFFW